MISYRIANILLHVILISAFLVVFFFTYAARVESEIVESQSKAIVKDIADEVKILLPDAYINKLGSSIDSIQSPDMRDEDQKVKEANDKLKADVIRVITIVIFIGLTVVWLISHFYGNKQFTFTGIVTHNIIILAFVALTEFVFLNYFARNYISIDSNYVKYVILKTLSDRTK